MVGEKILQNQGILVLVTTVRKNLHFEELISSNERAERTAVKPEVSTRSDILYFLFGEILFLSGKSQESLKSDDCGNLAIFMWRFLEILRPRDKRLLECKPMYVPLINYQLSLTLCTDCLRVICV